MKRKLSVDSEDGISPMSFGRALWLGCRFRVPLSFFLLSGSIYVLNHGSLHGVFLWKWLFLLLVLSGLGGLAVGVSIWYRSRRLARSSSW